MTYVAYASSDNGNGYVQKLGEYDDIDDIIIRVGMFADDVVINIEEYSQEEVTS